MYFIAETEANGFVNNPQRWYPCRAKSPSGAMRAAQRAQVFQGTALHVAVKRGDRFERIAVRRPDAINMNLNGRWVEIDGAED